MMKTNNNTRSLGDNNVQVYQISIVLIAIVIFLFFVIVYFVFKNINFLLSGGISFLFFSMLVYLYSKVFSIKYDKEGFVLKNVYSTKYIKAERFIEIKAIRFLDFVYRISFNEDSFYFLINSDEYYKTLFKRKRTIAEKMTNDVNEYINSTPAPPPKTKIIIPNIG